METLIAGAAQLGISLSPHQVQQFQTYYDELVAWNQRFNLTSITTYDEVQVRHFLDSLSAVLVEDLPRSPLMDVGSGAGFPGLALKIAFPELRLTLLDSVGKKTGFLQHIVGMLGLDGVDIITERSEVAAHDATQRERSACVVARALAPMPALLELTLPFCSLGGMLVYYKGAAVNAEMARSERALALLGGRWRQVVKVPVEGLRGRVLVVVDKVAPTPALYPRRVGAPAHRPLV